jgi:hypothetical protein
MKTVLIETQYLPPIPYFTILLQQDSVVLERHEHFTKQSYRNRCTILTAQGQQNLIVPLTYKHGKVFITDVRIDYSQKWLNNHWRAIESAYRKAPFFEHYGDDLQEALFKKQAFLYDLNIEILTICLRWLRSKIKIQESMSYEKTPGEGIIDLRNSIHPKKAELLGAHGDVMAYPQVFGNKFVEHLSILDLIMCEGPSAPSFVGYSARLQ